MKSTQAKQCIALVASRYSELFETVGLKIAQLLVSSFTASARATNRDGWFVFLKALSEPATHPLPPSIRQSFFGMTATPFRVALGQRDFLEQQRWAEIRDTIAACLEAGVVPIINENDTTNTDGMRFGDNDNLAALTAVQLGAAGVFLFTDVDYLYTARA